MSQPLAQVHCANRRIRPRFACRCQESTNRLSIKFKAREGNPGKVTAYIIPAMPPKTCSVIEVQLPPLCMHQMVSSIPGASMDGADAAAEEQQAAAGTEGSPLLRKLAQSRPCSNMNLQGRLYMQGAASYIAAWQSAGACRKLQLEGLLCIYQLYTLDFAYAADSTVLSLATAAQAHAHHAASCRVLFRQFQCAGHPHLAAWGAARCAAAPAQWQQLRQPAVAGVPAGLYAGLPVHYRTGRIYVVSASAASIAMVMCCKEGARPCCGCCSWST
eukprot:GHRQ01038857.1.p1 GENE.GHRQ01038857.1~~GHRQ01038857.1.p1  ORF type:complete len:302 (-),score=65.21 GHRQ01038857.1:103-921(-)